MMKFAIFALLCLAACTVQAETIAKPEGGAHCALCEYVAKELDAILGQNATQAEVIDAVENVCNILPKTLQGECKQLIFNFGPVIINMLVSKVTPDALCTKIGLCTTANVQGGPECPICEFVMKIADAELSRNSTEADVLNTLAGICKKVPASISDECSALLSEFGPAIYAALVAKIDPSKVCTAVGLCTAKTAELKKSTASPLCPICTYLLETIEKLAGENATETKIIDAVESVCKVVPSSLESQCQKLVFDYGPVIINALINRIPPSKVCTAIGLCKNSTFTDMVEITPVAQVAGGPDCPLCSFILKELDNILGENRTETEVLQALAKVCSKLPKTIQSECSALIQNFGPTIYAALIARIDPTQVCTAIGLCTAAVRARVAGPKCPLCEYVIKNVEEILSSNHTEQEVIDAVETVCTILPKGVQAECKELVFNYGPIIINLLIKREDPATLCTKIGLCSNSTIEAVKATAAPAKPQSDCALCELVASELDQMLKDNSTEAEIITALEKVCSKLPSSLAGECAALMQQFGPSILAALGNRVDPKQLCTVIGLCKTANVAAGPSCPICEFAMKVIDKELTNNSTEVEIIGALNRVCGYLPKTVTKECSALLETYGDALLRALAARIDPTRVCTAIGLCTSNVDYSVKLLKH